MNEMKRPAYRVDFTERYSAGISRDISLGEILSLNGVVEAYSGRDGRRRQISLSHSEEIGSI
jgi:outer membrane usher protein FimD/PapC